MVKAKRPRGAVLTPPNVMQALPFSSSHKNISIKRQVITWLISQAKIFGDDVLTEPILASLCCAAHVHQSCLLHCHMQTASPGPCNCCWSPS